MATSIIMDIGGNKTATAEDGSVYKIREFHRTFKSGEEKPTKNINNCDLLFYFNWHTLTDSEKFECGAQVWEFDSDAKVWHPLTELYTG